MIPIIIFTSTSAISKENMESVLDPGLDMVVIIREHVCDDVSKGNLKLST